MPSDILKAIQQINEKAQKKNKTETRGQVINATQTLAMVKIGGSGRAQPCRIPAGIDVSPNDIVELVPNKSVGGIRWVVSDVVGKHPVGKGIGGGGQPYTELYPPLNVRVSDVIAGAVTVVWDSPVEINVVFEVETGDGVDTGVKVLQTSGSYAIIGTSSAINVRVRSIAPDGQASAYSPWVTGDPAITTRAGNYIQVPFAHNTVSPIAIFTALEGSFVTCVIVEVTTAFNGTAPTLKIGEAGTTDRLITTSENDLKTVGVYRTEPIYEYPASIDVQATYVASGSTVGAGVITIIF